VGAVLLNVGARRDVSRDEEMFVAKQTYVELRLSPLITCRKEAFDARGHPTRTQGQRHVITGKNLSTTTDVGSNFSLALCAKSLRRGSRDLSASIAMDVHATVPERRSTKRIGSLARHLVSAPSPQQSHFKFVVIGAGISGLVQTIRLIDSGLVVDPSREVLIVEKGGDVGGTWYWNRFPGCACDVESDAYLPFLNRMQYAPAEKYPSGKDIQAYLSQMAQQLGLRQLVRFQTEAKRAVYHDGRGAAPNHWAITLHPDDAALNSRCHYEVTCNYVFFAIGPLSTPRMPNVKNLDRFRGKLIHSAHWTDNINLADKVVGVVGTGATAVQIVPQIAKVAKKLIVFQRTPCWCGPRHNRNLTEAEIEVCSSGCH